jgi:NAD(P)-dependent dehydrogenase (short-subunit alcohol dehydrogenase family)
VKVDVAIDQQRDDRHLHRLAVVSVLFEARAGGAELFSEACPAFVPHVERGDTTSDELLHELTQREAFGRAAEPWEVANVMVFLASDYSSYLTGEVVSVSSQHA